MHAKILKYTHAATYTHIHLNTHTAGSKKCSPKKSYEFNLPKLRISLDV